MRGTRRWWWPSPPCQPRPPGPARSVGPSPPPATAGQYQTSSATGRGVLQCQSCRAGCSASRRLRHLGNRWHTSRAPWAQLAARLNSARRVALRFFCGEHAAKMRRKCAPLLAGQMMRRRHYGGSDLGERAEVDAQRHNGISLVNRHPRGTADVDAGQTQYMRARAGHQPVRQRPRRLVGDHLTGTRNFPSVLAQPHAEYGPSTAGPISVTLHRDHIRQPVTQPQRRGQAMENCGQRPHQQHFVVDDGLPSMAYPQRR